MRSRLLAIALIPMLVILPLLLGVSIYRWNTKFDAITVSKVNDDLTIARQYLGRILDKMEARLKSVTESAQFHKLLIKTDHSDGELGAYFEDISRERKLDFLYAVTDNGQIIASGFPFTSESIRWNWPIISSALEGRSKTSIDVFQSAELAAMSVELAKKARIEIVNTRDNAASGLKEEKRGLVLQSASGFVLPDGRHAAIVGGILLNHNLAFVDTINDLIFHGSGLPEGSVGTVTLFLGDVRISTNVRLFENRRAIGTRVSAEVGSAVLDQGRTWLNSAFVVNDWYISAYEPIVDSYEHRVGMLYAGFLERPFTQAKLGTLLSIGAAFLLAVAATVPMFLIWASSIFRPLERMTGTIARVKDGDLSARTGPVQNQDEIGQVASHLDHLLNLLQERDGELRHLNGRLNQMNQELNQRVEQRALELHDATHRLEATTKQLVMSEKLAAIGEITAGIAHEINNPIAVMQGNLEVIRELMGSKALKAGTEFQLIDQQLDRVAEIVSKLLQFAKPQEFVGYSELYTAAGIISDTLPLVQHLLKKTTIIVEREDHALRTVKVNRTELQQVLVNLIVNAIHAMPNGGRLKLQTFDSDTEDEDGVAIEVTDTGDGMHPEVMEKIFDPFFTTKVREGTGLGLSISQMLMTRQGGKILVRSEVGKGTTFTIWLPKAD